MTRLRCAIYTRKSTDEGLDQDFNSLDAQREACEAFIESQKSEGWKLVRTRYDDGGLSGGNMERPALLQLLDDVRSGKVDTIVVYKVDRLTRSLADFAKIVEILDDNNASFVSVTQAFNTTTSMGRLTLNVLLSFAQFEREVTAERIRDKIAASRKKGMWMGGPVPLGYDVVDKKIIINAGEAGAIRTLFRLYLKLDTVRDLKEEADRRGYRTKQQTYSTGRKVGGCPFTRGRLYHLLRNPLYIGRVKHKEETYAGQHEGIIDQELWDAVQAKLDGRVVRTKDQIPSTNRPLLLGLLHDESGRPLTTNHAIKNGRRYGYYISKGLNGKAEDTNSGWRLPARRIEDVVLSGIRGFLNDPARMMDAAQTTLPKDERPSPDAWTGMLPGDLGREQVRDLVTRINLARDGITLLLDMRRVVSLVIPSADRHSEVRSDAIFSIKQPITLKRRGSEMRIVLEGQTKQPVSTDGNLVAMIARAHSWFEDLKTGQALSLEDIARNEQMSASDVSRYLPLAFLAPDIVEAILDGSQPAELTLQRVKRMPPLPLSWQDQRIQLGFQS